MVYGELMRAPVLFDVDSTEVEFWDNSAVEIPDILTAAYMKVDSLGAGRDSLAFIFTNYSDTTIHDCTSDTFSVSIDLAGYFEPPPDSFQACVLISDGSTTACARVDGCIINKSIILASDSTAVFEITPIYNSSEYLEKPQIYMIKD